LHRAVTPDSFRVGRLFISLLPCTRTLHQMASLSPVRWLAIFLLSGGAVLTPAITAAGEPSCLPPPNLLVTQVGRTAGAGSTLWADLQAAAQRDTLLPTATGGQVVRDELAAINRDGYQWDCVTSRLVATSSATSPSTSATGVGRGPLARRAGQSAPTAPSPPAGPASRAAPSGKRSGSALNSASNSGNGNGVGSSIPTILIVVGLIASAGAVVFAVRRVNR
jgi:hypothetical protein